MDKVYVVFDENGKLQMIYGSKYDALCYCTTVLNNSVYNRNVHIREVGSEIFVTGFHRKELGNSKLFVIDEQKVY